MDFFETIGIWLVIPCVASVVLVVLLIFLKALSEWISNNKNIFDKLISFFSLVGGIAFAGLALLTIIVGIFLIIKKIF